MPVCPFRRPFPGLKHWITLSGPGSWVLQQLPKLGRGGGITTIKIMNSWLSMRLNTQWNLGTRGEARISVACSNQM